MAKLTDKLLRKLQHWLRGEQPASVYSAIRIVESMGDVPEHLGQDIYVVTRSGSHRWLLLMCPCGCGDRLSVNLMQTVSPHWRLTLKRGKASLSPSLWVTHEKCGSHFWLLNNGVYWCPRYREFD
jgi:hypothetical protein